MNNRSQVSFDAGYLIGSAFTARFMGSWETTHGGWRVPIDWPARTSPEFLVHDQVAREEYLQLGGALSYTLSETVDVNVFGYDTLSSRNYVDMKGLGMSLTYSASPAQLLRKKRRRDTANP